jgi:hypothetical protein
MEINFDNKSKREHTIKNNYRPGFKIKEIGFFSGKIELIDNISLKPGFSCKAIVGFFSNEPFVDVKVGDTFDFYEVPHKIGSATLIKFIGWLD